MGTWSLWLQEDSKAREGAFPWPLLKLICRQENCAERRRMEEDLPARWGPTAASECSGGPSQALAVPIQMWVLGLETCSQKILTWQRGF